MESVTLAVVDNTHEFAQRLPISGLLPNYAQTGTKVHLAVTIPVDGIGCKVKSRPSHINWLPVVETLRTLAQGGTPVATLELFWCSHI